MAALPLPRRTRGGGSVSLFFIAGAARRGVVAIFYFPSRRGSGRCSAAMDISGSRPIINLNSFQVVQSTRMLANDQFTIDIGKICSLNGTEQMKIYETFYWLNAGNSNDLIFIEYESKNSLPRSVLLGSIRSN